MNRLAGKDCGRKIDDEKELQRKCIVHAKRLE